MNLNKTQTPYYVHAAVPAYRSTFLSATFLLTSLSNPILCFLGMLASFLNLLFLLYFYTSSISLKNIRKTRYLKKGINKFDSQTEKKK